jgi:N-acetylglucosamine-6-phosphate deacetylase
MRLGVSAAFVDGALLAGDVDVSDGVVSEVGLPAGRGGVAIAGMVDLQVNGYAGVDFLGADVEAWATASRAMARAGVTSYVANLITSPAPVVTEALGVAAKVQTVAADDGARLLGAHLEGPFLSPAKAGTHPVEHLRAPDVALLSRLIEAGPVVGVTVAPELPGALELIAWLRSRGVLVALGHSVADDVAANAGFDAGASAVTHIFNAMPALTSRSPGLAGVALTRPDVAVELICDGVHLARDIVVLVVAAAGERFVLVTDALSAAGAGPGQHHLGEMELSVVDGVARRPDGTLAGSVLSMADALRNVIEAGATFEQAVAAAASRPAALLGRDDVGRLTPGARADVVVLDDTLTVTTTLLGGVVVEGL